MPAANALTDLERQQPITDTHLDAEASILFAVTSQRCVLSKRKPFSHGAETTSDIWVRLRPEDGIKVASISEAEDRLLSGTPSRVCRPHDSTALINSILFEIAMEEFGSAVHASKGGLRERFNYILMHPGLFHAIRPWGRWTPMNATQGHKHVGRWTKVGAFGTDASIYTSGHLSPDEFYLLRNGQTGSPRLMDGPAILFNVGGELRLTLTPKLPVAIGSFANYIRRVQFV